MKEVNGGDRNNKTKVFVNVYIFEFYVTHKQNFVKNGHYSNHLFTIKL